MPPYLNQPEAVVASQIQSVSGIGDLRLHEFESRIFRNRRMLRVWLPPGYHNDENRNRYYPVFYLSDGQNLFDRATAYIGVDWQVGETASRLMDENKIPPIIFVGVDNAQKDRAKEYLPYRSLNPAVLRPQGRRYPEFLITEVMPFVGHRYRLASGPENTGLGGSSLGAIISLYTAIARPGTFGRLLLESPSLFVSNRQLLRQARVFRSWPERIFLAIGTRESGRADRDIEVVDDVRHLQRILQRTGLGADRLMVKIDEGATHSESEWAKRFPEALQFLFGIRIVK
jgi:predicted alpha/beta superfamily hydrolase